MSSEIKNIDFIEYIISEESKGLRADQAISMENDKFSRSLIQKWIKKGRVLVNGRKIKPKDIVNLNDKITINPEENINPEEIKPDLGKFNNSGYKCARPFATVPLLWPAAG